MVTTPGSRAIVQQKFDSLFTRRNPLKIPNGTVLRWTRVFRADGPKYTYAAIYIKALDLWYSTGAPSGSGGGTYRTHDLIVTLASDSVIKAEISNGWTSLYA